MGWLSLLLLACALSMDAFAVALVAGGGLVAARNSGQLEIRFGHQLAALPGEAAIRLRLRVGDESDLPGSGKEALMNEQVVVGQEDAEAGVAVVPADDPLVGKTLMRWGNYDVVNAAVRWVASEVPSGVTPLGNAVPANQNLPPSFYLAQKPGFWPSGRPWPPMGPDVSGGNLANLGGHANRIPALDCYQSMGGPADGTGSPLTFSAAACYP